MAVSQRRAVSRLCIGFMLSALGIGNTAFAQQQAVTPSPLQSVTATLPQPVVLRARASSYLTNPVRVVTFTQPVASVSECAALAEQYRRNHFNIRSALSLSASCILPAVGTQNEQIVPLRWNESDARYSFNNVSEARFTGLQAYTMTLMNFDRNLTPHVDGTQHANLDACLTALRQRVAELRVSLSLGSRGFCTDNNSETGPMPQRYVLRTSTGTITPYSRLLDPAAGNISSPAPQ